jgi:hypothetical protein
LNLLDLDELPDLCHGRRLEPAENIHEIQLPLLEINFLGVVPESRSSCRNGNGASASQSSADGGGGEAARRELRLLVLSSLPQTHQQYLFEEIRKLCRDYLRNWRVRASEMTAEELLSEIWHKLLQTVPLHNDERSVFTLADPADWSINHAPALDRAIHR